MASPQTAERSLGTPAAQWPECNDLPLGLGPALFIRWRAESPDDERVDPAGGERVAHAIAVGRGAGEAPAAERVRQRRHGAARLGLRRHVGEAAQSETVA